MPTAKTQAQRKALPSEPGFDRISNTLRVNRATRTLEVGYDDGAGDGEAICFDDETFWFYWNDVTREDGWAFCISHALLNDPEEDSIWDLIEEFGVEATRSTYVDGEPTILSLYVMPDASVLTPRGTVATEEEMGQIWGDDWVTEPERIALERVREMEASR